MTLLIKNVQIVGGAGNNANGATTDVFVSDNKISAIGSFPNKKADMVLDGQGAYLSPGFIDSNTGSDHYLTLFDNPNQEDFIKQGVTTIMGGMCGASLAPLLYGSLEALQKWGDPNRTNVSWHTMGEFLKVMDKHPTSVNFGTLVGHATVRRALVGLANRHGAGIVTLVSETVRRWDARTVSRRIEAAVGRDLQYIRMNGTLVGGCVGLALHAVERWV